MVRQVGTTLHTDERGIARRGIIIRHLVLPGFVDNSIGVLRLIAEDLSPNLHISLMSQYYPTLFLVSPPEPGGVAAQKRGGGGLSGSETGTLKPLNTEPLKHPITSSEYDHVVATFHCLNFTRGWLQDYDSHTSIRPDFSRRNPFEE